MIIEIDIPDDRIDAAMDRAIAKKERELSDKILSRLVDEEGALELLPITGKDPRRTFRRMANKHRLEYVRIDGFKWFTVEGILQLRDKHTVNRKKSEIGGQKSEIEDRRSELRAVA